MKKIVIDINIFMDFLFKAVIEISSKENGAEYILIRNTRDFKKSIVKAITPEGLLVILKNDALEESKNI
jgi:hypothetical protein